MKRILVLSYRFPYPLIDGSRIRIYNVGKILAEKYQVDLLAINEGKIAIGDIEETEKIFNKVIPFSFNPVLFKINTLKGLFSKNSLQIYYHHFYKVQKWIYQHYEEYDLIFCVHIRMTKYLEKIKNITKVIDFIDATSINYQEAQKNSTGMWNFIYPVENKRALLYEIKILKEYDKAFITSPFDKKYLLDNTEVSTNKLIVIPNGVKEELLFRENKFKEENWIVFLGKMNTAPNVDAVIYFANEIFPLIIKNKNDVRFIIVGSSPTKEVLKLGKRKSIDVTGFVEDPYEYLEKAKIIVAPLRFGAGTQYKILEAMALGKVVVTTSKGARGISGEDDKHFITVDNEKEMAKKILDLIDDKLKRDRIGNNAKKLINSKYRWDIIGEKLYKEINKVLRESKL
jgi:sugar transferase (PEP-CTERM/EpsH1 system associated)